MRDSCKQVCAARLMNIGESDKFNIHMTISATINHEDCPLCASLV